MEITKGKKVNNLPQLVIMAVGAVICLIAALVLADYTKERNMFNKYSGMKVTWYGDSLTQQYSYCELVDGYFGFAGHNSGINNTLITNVGDSSMCEPIRMKYGTVDDIAPDSGIIFVMGGVNDWLENISIGDIDKSFEDAQNDILDGSTFAGACNQMFYYLKEMYPNAEIIVLGTPFANAGEYDVFENTDGIHNEIGLTSVEYGDVLCRVAELWEIKNMNIGRVLKWDESNIYAYSPDGIHFGHDTGSVEAADVIVDFIRKINGVS